ncbi:hypothetical protein EB093_07010 [bacterium]|nr:hypothetical protein [bacterium]
MEFKDALAKVLVFEGGFTDNPKDPGGATNYGITQAVAKAHGYTGDMKTIPMQTVELIYRKAYWNAIRADELPPQVRYPVFDAAVNSGVTQSIKWLQRSVGVLDDGTIGSKTVAAVKLADPLKIVCGVIGQRLEFMTRLPTWGTFGAGWTRRVCSILGA